MRQQFNVERPNIPVPRQQFVQGCLSHNKGVSMGLFSLESADFRPLCKGKVRELYEVGDNLLMVASDRISAFDVVMGSAVPGKGALLNRMSGFWFKKLVNICPNHLVSDDDEVISSLVGNRIELKNRAMLVKRCEPLPIECVVRGYLAGSLYKAYRDGQNDEFGLDIPGGLSESQKLPEPIFTPATKAYEGHDENISFSKATDLVGIEVAELARKWSLELYNSAADHADSIGLILADTKFEFGISDGELILIDEALTPDSSRYWEKSTYKTGTSPASYDKQFLRDYLETLDWNKQAPGPVLPAEIISATRERYLEAYRLITGHVLDL